MVRNADFVKMVANISGYTIKDTKAILDAVQAAMVEVLKEPTRVRFGGFSFESKVVPAHVGRNPATGEAIDIPEKIRVVAKPLPSTKSAINGD